MLNWISQNKQWLFSGVGVTVALFVLGFVYRRFFARSGATLSIPAPPQSLLPAALVTAQEPGSQTTPGPAILTKPNPDEIQKHIAALPPFQREAAAESYRGLKVCWKAVFRNLWEEPTNEKKSKKQKRWIVMLKHYDRKVDYSAETILCRGIDLEAYPRLKIAHTNDGVIVRGTIESVESNLHLRDVTIEFI